jgi:hypothetical protein
MHVKSTLILATAGRRVVDQPELSITHVTDDNLGSNFRRHCWLVVSYLVDFYRELMPLATIVRDLHSLAGAISDLAVELEGGHVEKAA